jgi:hypothetical protein
MNKEIPPIVYCLRYTNCTCNLFFITSLTKKSLSCRRKSLSAVYFLIYPPSVSIQIDQIGDKRIRYIIKVKFMVHFVSTHISDMIV